MLNIEVIQSELRSDKPCGASVFKNSYGVAVDIGTTNVTMSIFQWENGERLATKIFRNPQHKYGTDVIARMLKASQDASLANDLHDRLFKQIREGLLELMQITDTSPEDITGMGVVGNTAMLALFYNCSFQQLLDPDYWEKKLVFPDVNKKDITGFFQLCQQTSIEVIDPLAGFVGSDLLAGVTAIRLLNKEPGTLFLDFGTNTEMAFWDGRTVWVTAASGGPAFEGCGMSYGSAAMPGAIFQARRSRDTERPFTILTIEDKEPIGICGSGYVDIIGTLLEMNILDSIGRLSGESVQNQEITIMDNPAIKITKRDIDMFQRAKAAVAAGIGVLLHRAGMFPADISEIYVAGNFGRFLDVANAQRVGLLPGINPDRVYLCGNAALRGCEDIMLYKTAREMLNTIRKKVHYINLAFDSEFESIFINSLYLKPF